MSEEEKNETAEQEAKREKQEETKDKAEAEKQEEKSEKASSAEATETGQESTETKETETQPQPKPESQPKSVSREEYDSLKNEIDGLKSSRKQEVVQRRVDKAIDEKYIDSDDADAVANVREIAKNDESWASYQKIASPKTPAHITAQRFQSENLKSNKHTGDGKTLETVLEHQKN